MDGVEEVHAHEILGPCQGGRHFVHGQGGCVRGQNTVFAHGILCLSQDDPLDVHLFHDRFDDQVLTCESFVSEAAGDERHPLICLTPPKFSSLHKAGEELASVLKTARNGIVANVLHADVHAPVGGELCDSTSHHTGPQHREVLYASGLDGLVINSGPFACFLSEVEDVDQILADG